MKLKRLLAYMLTVCMLVSMLAFSVFADGLEPSGSCGAVEGVDDVRWSYDGATGTLTISGTGAMKEYEFYGDGPSATPWREYDLKKIVIEDGVTSISMGAFAFMGGSFTVEMADSVVSIGKNAFYHSGLTDIRLSENVTQLGGGALQSTGLKNLVIPDSVKALPQYAFFESGLQTITIGKGITMIDCTMLQKCALLTTIYFTGDAPDTDYGLNINPNGAYDFPKVTIYYPANNETWTQEKRDTLGEEFAWLTYIPCKTGCSHAVKEVPAKAATYTESGNIQYYTCGNCGKLFADSEAKTQILDAASVVIPKLVHTHAVKEVPAKAATYTADGNIRYYACTGCDKLFADSEAKTAVDAAAVVIPKLVQVQQNTAVLTDDAVEQAITAGKTEVILPLEQLGTAISKVELSAESVETVSKLDQSATLTVPMDGLAVTLDNKTMQTILKHADGKEDATLQLQVKKIDAAQLSQTQQNAIKNNKVAAVISANMISGGKDIHDFEGGKVTISVPYALPANANAANYKVLYVADDGKTEDMAAAYKDGKFVFTVSHFSEYVIVEAKQPATPVTGDSFAMLPVLGILLASAAGLVLLAANKKRLYQ